MIKKTYIHRDSGEIIKIDLETNFLFIGNDANYLEKSRITRIKNLYKYNKEIFKEFIENIYTKYNFNMINFLINNNVTLKEIKKISNIILFPIKLHCKNFILSNYEINIMDFFKYIYSQPYEYINSKFCYKYFYYLKNNKAKINKFNKFPHNIFLVYDIYKNNKIKRNDNKDIIKDIDDFHIEFYGSKCEYYITYKRKKYNLLNHSDIIMISSYLMGYTKIIYLSEYYKNDSLYNIIMDFKDKKYYTKTIKEDIFYLLKDSYKDMNKKEIDKIQKIILKTTKDIYNIEGNFFTNNFKKNLYIIDYLSSNTTEKDFTNIIINKDFYNTRNRELANIYHKNIFKKESFKTIKTIDNIIIKEINLLEFFNSINKNEYLKKDINILLDSYIYLCTDKKSGDKLFVYKIFKNSEINHIVKFLNKKYNSIFLERIENLKI